MHFVAYKAGHMYQTYCDISKTKQENEKMQNKLLCSFYSSFK
jgi:hypothetical protein